MIFSFPLIWNQYCITESFVSTLKIPMGCCFYCRGCFSLLCFLSVFLYFYFENTTAFIIGKCLFIASFVLNQFSYTFCPSVMTSSLLLLSLHIFRSTPECIKRTICLCWEIMFIKLDFYIYLGRHLNVLKELSISVERSCSLNRIIPSLSLIYPPK